MDAFEQLVADLLWAEGYWVRTGVKVDLTREKGADRASILPALGGRPGAYKPASNGVLALACKSYLDSGGVHAPQCNPEHKLAGRYKLFDQPLVREVVLSRLADRLRQSGLSTFAGTPQQGLVHGLAGPTSEQKLRALFAANDWLLFGPEWIDNGSSGPPAGASAGWRSIATAGRWSIAASSR